MSRLLRVVLVVCLLALVPGCGSGTRDPLVVLGPWTGEEGRAFEALLDKLDDGTGRTYTYEGTRSLRETLGARIDESLANGRLAFLDGLAPFVFPAGLAAAAVIAGTLHAYRREYLVVTRPGAVA